MVDHDRTALAVRTLIGRLRATDYNPNFAEARPPQPEWWRYVLDDHAAVQAVLQFALSENAQTLERRNARYALLLHCAMLQLCDHGVTANSSALVREIRDLLGGA
jgi:hypothetical protein